jgi:hypothetical protein
MPVYGPSAHFPAPKIGQHGDGKIQCGADQFVVEAIGSQLAYFKNINPPCRGLELPDGILLRSTRSASLYFYLRTGVDNGRIKTHMSSLRIRRLIARRQALAQSLLRCSSPRPITTT